MKIYDFLRQNCTTRDLALMVQCQLVQCQSTLFHLMEWSSCQWTPSVDVLLLPSIWLQPLLSLLVHIPLLVELQNFACRIWHNYSHNESFRRKILTQDWELSFFTDWIRTSDSEFEVLKTRCDFQYRSNSRVPRVHPFCWEAWSSRGRVYSRQAIVCRRNTLAFFVTKYCKTSTTLTNPASSQKDIGSFRFFTSWWFSFVFSENNWIDLPVLRVPPCYLAGLHNHRIWLPLPRRYWADWQRK